MEPSASGVSVSKEGYASDCNRSSLSMEDSRLMPDLSTLTRSDFEVLLARTRQLEEELASYKSDGGKEAGGAPLKCGYLFKHRPWARFLEKPWEVRFVVVSRNTLSFWKSDSESSSRMPHGLYDLTGCTVYVEGLKKNRFFVFQITDSEGGTLLRLSSASEADGRHWVKHLESIGCAVVPEDDQAGLEESVSTLSGEEPATQEQQQQQQRSVKAKVEGQLRHRIRPISTRPEQADKVEEQGLAASATKSPSGRRRLGPASTLRASAPAHRFPKESPLSSDAIFSQSHAGLFNLCVVVLLAVNGRLIVENLIKYGFLVRLGFFWYQGDSLQDWPLLECALVLPVFPLLALGLEKLKANWNISEMVLALLHALNTSATFFLPAAVIIRSVNSAPLPGFVLIFVVVILSMKLISYAHTNADVRSLLAMGEKPDSSVDAPTVEYPENITLRNMLYFMVAPTLCYQLGYPRSKYVRKRWVLWQLTKLAVFLGLMMFIIEQYVNPTIKNSQHPLRGKPSAASVLFAVERVLKLSIPTLYVWLCMFYCFFHLWLNIVAEVICFGDREFYRDWWNAKTVEEYWRLWNMPVHRWMVRHLYFPCIRRGMSKPAALFVVFFFSAVLHEVVVGIPCHMLRCWAFLGIMFQVPLVAITNFLYRKFDKPMVGNMIFWFFFCIVGQPICVLLYYHDVVSQSRPNPPL